MIKAKFLKSKKRLASHFIFSVSMGSERSSDRYLESIVNLINNTETLQHGIIVISDLLARYRIQARGAGQWDACKKSFKLGEEWERRNKKTLSNLKPEVEITDWGFWLDQPEYKATQKQFEDVASQDETLNRAIKTDIDKFYKRIGQEYVNEQDKSLSRAFIIEELAAMQIQSLYMGVSSHAVVHIYAGKQIEALKAVRSGKIKGMEAGLSQTTFNTINVYETIET